MGVQIQKLKKENVLKFHKNQGSEGLKANFQIVMDQYTYLNFAMQ